MLTSPFCRCSIMFQRLDGIPEPPAGYVPPMGSSRNTWTNIYKNKGRIDYCVQQFSVSFPNIANDEHSTQHTTQHRWACGFGRRLTRPSRVAVLVEQAQVHRQAHRWAFPRVNVSLLTKQGGASVRNWTRGWGACTLGLVLNVAQPGMVGPAD